MEFHTDLALERQECCKDIPTENVEVHHTQKAHAKITEIHILNAAGAQELQKPIGHYITVEIPEFAEDSALLDDRLSAVTDAISHLLPTTANSVLVAGLGNEKITPDALGPKTANGVFATRHIDKSTAIRLGLGALRPVSVFALGVLGQTGIESAQLLSGLVEHFHPDAVITIDALAASHPARLGNTIQLTDTGITPGSGIGNHRAQISQETLGVPVLSIGVPTVIDTRSILSPDGNAPLSDTEAVHMVVCPKDIDTLLHRAARFLSLAINCALQPYISPEILLSLS